MNNAVYGKTIKNLRKRIDVRLISNKKVLKYQSINIILKFILIL